MASVWHEGLVESFPVPQPKSSSSSQTAQVIEEAIRALDISPAPLQLHSPTPFPFFSLPAEIRNRIYSLVLFSAGKPLNPRPSPRRLPTSLFLTSSRIHHETSYLFYTSHTFRLFPLQEFKPLPTVSELPLRYRHLVTNVELILGPGWTAPPKSWKVTQRMTKILKQLSQVRCLKVFVEIDPSHPVFARFRVSHGFYTDFAGNLLRDVIVAMPQIEFVQLDGNPSVQMEGPLVSRLRREIEAGGREVTWGKERGWSATDRSGLQAEIRSEGPLNWAEEKHEQLRETMRNAGAALV
jgi:hypothetical protein